MGNLCDCDIFSIKTCRRTGNEIVEHLPREISRQIMLDRGAVITPTLTFDSYRRSHYQGGWEIPCNVKVTIADTEKVFKLINAYSELELMSKP